MNKKQLIYIAFLWALFLIGTFCVGRFVDDIPIKYMALVILSISLAITVIIVSIIFVYLIWFIYDELGDKNKENEIRNVK